MSSCWQWVLCALESFGLFREIFLRQISSVSYVIDSVPSILRLVGRVGSKMLIEMRNVPKAPR